MNLNAREIRREHLANIIYFRCEIGRRLASPKKISAKNTLFLRRVQACLYVFTMQKEEGKRSWTGIIWEEEDVIYVLDRSQITLSTEAEEGGGGCDNSPLEIMIRPILYENW